MTGFENMLEQRNRLKRGRAEFARQVTEAATKQAIKDGRVYYPYMSDELVPSPEKEPRRKPWSRSNYAPMGPQTNTVIHINGSNACLPVKAFEPKEKTVAKAVGQKVAKGWRGAVRKITDVWKRVR